MKNIVTIILILVLIALAGFTSYVYSGAMKCKAIATDLGTKLQQCAAGAKTCQDVLTALGQVPACAPYLQAQ